MKKVSTMLARLLKWEQKAKARWEQGKQLTQSQLDNLEQMGWDIEDMSADALEAGNDTLNDVIVDELESKHGDLRTMTDNEADMIKELNTRQLQPN